MQKIAAMEETEVVDPKTNKPIRISTTNRLVFRHSFDEYREVRNARLNILIAKDFAEKANSVLHYFRLGEKEKTRTEFSPEGAEKGQVYANVGEIRGTSSFYYISAVREDSIDILTIQNSWIKPKYRGTEEKPIELSGEE